MSEVNQELYLSELFLKTLNRDFSLEAVLKALSKCDNEVLQKLKVYRYVSMINRQLPRRLGLIRIVVENIQQEIYDFLDVYEEFDDMLTLEMKKKYFILQII